MPFVLLLSAPHQMTTDQVCVSQSCPELAGEAVDYLENSDDSGLEAPPSQLVILAVDETPDAEHLEHLKTALAEVKLTEECQWSAGTV